MWLWKFTIVCVQVAVGEICEVDSTHSGSQPMTLGKPILKSPIKGDRADTCVDVLDRDKAEVFCIFEKAQALPRFLIEFREV